MDERINLAVPLRTPFNAKGLRGIGGLRSKHHLFNGVNAAMLLVARFGRVNVEDLKASARQHAEERTFPAKIIDWCDDFLELLDLLCELARAKKSLVRSEGLKFFSSINNNFVRAIQSPWK